MAGRHPLRDAFEPRAIALVGATDRPGSVGQVLLSHILESFTGPVGLVNAKSRRLAGRDTVPQPEDLAETPDLAVVATPPAGLVRAIEGLAARGCKAAVIITDNRRGGALAASHDALRAAAGPMRLIGPGSLGAAAPWGGVYASLSNLRPDPGGLAFVARSALPAAALADWAKARGIGFSHILALGDMADVDYADALNLIADSPRATAAVLVLRDEAIDARRFLSAGRALARVKPVIVMRTAVPEDPPGRNQAFDAAFARAGMLRVSRLEEILGAVEAVSARSPGDPRLTRLGDRLAVVSNSAALAALAVERLAPAGARAAVLSEAALARIVRDGVEAGGGMVDLTPEADAAAYRTALEVVTEEPGVDAVLVINGPAGVDDGRAVAEAVADFVAARRQRPGARKPWVFACWPGGAHALAAAAVFDAANIPYFQTPSEAIDAYGRLLAHRRLQEALMQTPRSRPEAFGLDRTAAAGVIAGALKQGRDSLSASEARDTLSAYNIHGPGAQTLACAGEASLRPVAARVRMTVDAVFGPVLSLGLADPIGRALDPGVAGLPPLTLALAEQMVARSRVRGFLEPDGEAALALLLAQTAQLVADHPEIAALDFDPVWVGAAAQVGTARVDLTPGHSADPRARLAIRPYPSELERIVSDRAGARYLLRPIRPEDEPALIALIGRLDPEHLRLRFFQPIRHVSHEFAARLTQIDYDREMALVLVDEGGRPGDCVIRGVARLARNGDPEVGEYAVTVESGLQGRGLGRLLMQVIVEDAHRQGLSEVFGLVLPENRAMLALAEELGFVRAPDPDDPHVARVTLQLQKIDETAA